MMTEQDDQKEAERVSTTVARLSQGESPLDESVVGRLSVGSDFLTDFWRDRYLREFIKEGGSKIKFLTGRSGSGKTHMLCLFDSIARKENYLVVPFSARNVWLNSFREIYLEILNQCDIMDLLRRCSTHVVEAMGFSAAQIPEGMTFLDFLGQQGLSDGLTKREIRVQLKQMFLDNPRFDNNFALACSLICGGILGHPLLEEPNKEILLSWFHGEKGIRVTMLRPLGLAPSKLTKYNARNMLRSLSELIHLAGYAGLLVSVDNLEILLNTSTLNPLHYTKMRREDTYESIRQLIDDIDTFSNIMFVFGFDRSLLDNEKMGIKSYQALWMRIQNEVVGSRINKFGDIIDLDALAMETLGPERLVEMSQRLVQVLNNTNLQANPIDGQTARHLLDRARLSNIALPRLIGQATLGLMPQPEEQTDVAPEKGGM